MYSNDEEKKKREGVKALFIVAIVILVTILLIITFKGLFRKNPYGNEIKIDNFSKYFKGVPQDTTDSIFSMLYNIAANNVENTTNLPKSGALVRDGQYETEYDEITKVYTSKAVIDIESIKQSYQLNFSWSKKTRNNNLAGNIISFTCLSDDLDIYNFDCKKNDDELYSDFISNNPIIYSLPINVEYYTNNYSEYVKYSITYKISKDDSDNEKIILVIDDYTGDNYNKALQSIENRGYDYNDYTIEYNNLKDQE